MAILSAVDGLGFHESPTMTQTVLSPKVVADKSALGGIISAYPIAKKRIAAGIANIWHAAIDFSSMEWASSHRPLHFTTFSASFGCGAPSRRPDPRGSRALPLVWENGFDPVHQNATRSIAVR
jgi:hypothetical protein